MNSGYRFKKSEIGIFADKNTDIILQKLDKETRVIGLTNGEFSLIDLIYSTLKKIGKSDLIIATWSAGIKDAHQVKWIADNDYIGKFTLLTDHSYKTRQKKYAASIEELFGKENIRTSEIHAKFVLLSNENHKIIIRSSMNLNANKTSELFEIEDNLELYSTLYSYIKHHLDNMPAGFIEENRSVSECVNSFYKKNNQQENKIKKWYSNE